ncbi:phosphoadenosine phosphosulfate reductase family protein [Thiotrichales bacterium 19S3-7]|nr:phosphoadenosine phosphosulfate reductase family protein [Thiotrichales bacterium 19S3-7]MCF6802501.1 phosphoadenosine phosphosulfate reductase family protein [Thiotrichales bacterium 19S3-11]
MHVIIANFSDDSIALIQWASKKNLPNLHILYVDTRWSACYWYKRLELVQNWTNSLNIPLHILKPKQGFEALVIARKQFPSIRFQWCPGLLKGIPILNWLEENDDDETATILLPHRRSMSKSQDVLEEFVYESEHYDERTLWHPLYQHSISDRDSLIKKTPIPLLNHRSLECQPCIFSTNKDLVNLEVEDIQKVKSLEDKIQQSMFNPNDYDNAQSIDKVVSTLKQSPLVDDENYYDQFAQGCAWPYGCGL